MIIELALATQIPVSEWRAEDDITIVTALEVLRVQAEEVKKKRHGR